MNRLFARLFGAIGNVISAFFDIGIRLKYVVILLLLVGGGTYAITYYTVLDKVGGKEDFDEAMRYIEIKDKIDEYFIDPVDRRAMGDRAAAAMVSGLGDNWSYYMSEDQYRTYKISSATEYSDIGMSLVEDTASGGFQVLAVSPNSPAALAGLKVGMVITGIDLQKVTGYSIEDVRTLIRSKLNTKFYMEINGGQYTIMVDCSEISAVGVNYRMEKTDAGYVQINDFEVGSGQAAVDAIEKLLAQKAVALVIDLRGNPGGLTSEVATLLDYLLPRGRLFSEIDKSGKEVVTESDGLCIQLPMCVLVNSETFREAELCAAVLQEYNWAAVIGEPTVGNTRTQDTIPLEDGSALRLSTGSYLTSKGVDISQKGGVIPDTIVYNADASATGTTQGTTGGQDGTASTSDDVQLMQALNFLSRNQSY